MKNKLSLILIFLFLALPLVNGITGSIGNAKAIVNLDLKKSNILERTVLIKNVNNISVNIKLEAADDLEGITEIIDNNFLLKENEEKNARFKVNVPKEGTYNGNIIVFFKPIEGKGAGVVLQSNLIIKANGNSNIITNPNSDVKKENNTILSNNKQNTENNGLILDNTSPMSISLVLFLFLIAIVVIFGFILIINKL